MFLIIIQNKRPRRPDEPALSDGAWEAIQQCWAREPWKRPRMKNVIENLVATSQSVSLSTNAQTSTYINIQDYYSSIGRNQWCPIECSLSP